MRRTVILISSLAVLASLTVVGAPAAEAGSPPCSGSEVEVRGRVTDRATGQPLQEVTSVEVQGVTNPAFEDGFGTGGDSRYSICLLPGDYKIRWFADSYRVEWFHDQPNEASATVITVAGPGPVIVNESLVPRGRVIAGRVTNLSNVPKFASVGIWRLTSTGWRPYDGIANNAGNGWYEFVAPGPGRYRISADVDHHRSRWASPSKLRLSQARTFVLGVHSTYINDGHIRVPYCPESDGGAFCVPPGFFS